MLLVTCILTIFAVKKRERVVREPLKEMDMKTQSLSNDDAMLIASTFKHVMRQPVENASIGEIMD